jgi:hypothetical protein
MVGMEDTELHSDPCFDLDDFSFLPGVDLTLWLQIVIGLVVLAVAGGLVLGLAG